MKKRIIWSNNNINLDDWKDFLEEEHPDVEDEYEQYRLIAELNDEYLYDERANLDKVLDGRILVIGDLGRWNGRVNGYKIIDSQNIKDILYSDCEYCEWYSDGYNIRSAQHHHDGTNYLLYRVIREDRNIDNLLEMIYNGEEINSSKLNYYTRSLHKAVADVYGW